MPSSISSYENSSCPKRSLACQSTGLHGLRSRIRQTREGEAATIRATSKGRRRSIFCTTGLLHFWRNGPSRRVDLQAVGKPALREIGPELLCNGECRAVSSIVCASALGHHCSPWITPAASKHQPPACACIC